MGFDQFGIISFTATTKAEQFVDLLKENRLCGTVCKECGAKFFPPRSDCNVCLSDDMEWFEVAGDGILLSFTKAMFAPAGFEKDVPYALGVAEFLAGVKVFGRLSKTGDESKIKVGSKVGIRVVNLENDRLSYELVIK
jgi:uncharacterized protein